VLGDTISLTRQPPLLTQSGVVKRKESMAFLLAGVNNMALEKHMSMQERHLADLLFEIATAPCGEEEGCTVIIQYQ
jgi:hypothetical protein